MKKKLYIINGPNLNLLGRREPEKYGKASLETVKSMCLEKCKGYSLDLRFFQSFMNLLTASIASKYEFTPKPAITPVTTGEI